jgi:hypothetical protein
MLPTIDMFLKSLKLMVNHAVDMFLKSPEFFVCSNSSINKI